MDTDRVGIQPPAPPADGRVAAPRARLGLHAGLFAATVASTFLIGYLMSGSVLDAAGYSAAIMTILLVHEMGHYMTCRHYGVPASLPYFIPLPLPPFGTLGAVIRMRAQLRSRRSVLDIGAAGPLAGLAAAIPITLWGLRLSTLLPQGALPEDSWHLGESLLFGWLVRLVHGVPAPDVDVLLHPVAMAGWAGLFVTGLNLLPIGQLDGGHILFALLGRRARWGGLVLIGLLGVLTIFYHRSWWPLLVLLLLLGPGHPPVAAHEGLDGRRRWLGVLMLALFVLTFVPRPIVAPEP